MAVYILFDEKLLIQACIGYVFALLYGWGTGWPLLSLFALLWFPLYLALTSSHDNYPWKASAKQ
jgi:hypothetical protein